MKRLIALATLMILLIMGCTTKEELITADIAMSAKSFYVKVEHTYSDTKAHLHDKKNVVFDEGDKMAVFDKNEAVSEYAYSASESKFSGTSVATGGVLDNVHLLFPYSEDIKFSDNCVQGTLPAEQKYYQNSFDSNSQIMYAQVQELSEESAFEMKNMCGYLMLPLYGTDITVKDIVVSVPGANEYISGDFYISEVNETDDFELIMHSEVQNHENLSNSVTLDCSDVEGGGVQLGNTSEDATVFYISLPPQNYSKGFTVTITDIFGREFIKTAFSADGYELMRNHIKPMEPLQIVYDAEEELTISKDNDGNYITVIPTDSPERLLKWAYTVNHFNNSLGFTLQGNITMPAKTIVEDPENKTYIFTDTDITVTDGVPSGSNWVPVCSDVSELNDGYSGSIEGNGYKIQGILVNQSTNYVGFIGLMYNNSSVTNVNFDKCYIYGKESTGVVAGRAQNGTLISNVSVTSSMISGTFKVGGIVGYNYRRIKTGVNESLACIINSLTDEHTTIYGTGTEVGGICGYNYGAAIIGCVNNADVKGSSCVGGVVGYSREYYKDNVNSYVVACTSTANANITAIRDDGQAGGIIGHSHSDNDHDNAISYMVACNSFSIISAKNNGLLLGYVYGPLDYVIASWANGEGNIVAYNSSLATINHCYSYSAIPSDIETIITNMNQAIVNYNNNVNDAEGDAVEQIIKCHYKWQYNNNGWPTLVKDESVN